MSTRELERVEVMGRVAHKQVKLTDAAAMLELSYRQVKYGSDTSGWAAKVCSMGMWGERQIEASRAKFGAGC